MTSSLPGAWSLIVDSWNAFVKHWSTTVQYAAWLVPVAVIQQAYLLFPDQDARNAVMVLGFLVSALMGIWVTVRLYQVILALEGGQAVNAKTTAAAMLLVIPLALLGIVQMFATLGGLVLLILPGIYVGVRLAFSQLFLIEDGVTFQGTFGDKAKTTFRAIGAAISQSWEKTKDRFWPIFGRQLAAGLLFVILTMVVAGVAIAIVTLLVGGGANLDRIGNTPIGDFLLSLVNTLVQVAIISLMMVFQVKLYRALKRA
jgi:hypothetical protein